VNKAPFKIGELASLLGLSVRALHHYDHIGLLVPSEHTESGHRIYSEHDVSRLQQILSLRNIGFALDEIKQVMDEQSLSPLEIARMHIQRVKEKLHIHNTLLQRLEMIEQYFISHRNVTLKQFIETIEVIIMSEQKVTINMNKAVPILDVSDYTKSITYYCDKLGFRKNWEWGEPAGFGSVSRDQVELFITETPGGPFGTSMTVFVKDVDSLFTEFKSNGAIIVMAPQVMKWGVKELRVEDPDGHIIRFTQNLPCEDIVVERTEIRPRIEKRLAAVIEDLARETDRSLGDVIEEILLHSFEPVQGLEGQASASPHTIETYELIEKLKSKHNLNYGTHDSYGFVED